MDFQIPATTTQGEKKGWKEACVGVVGEKGLLGMPTTYSPTYMCARILCTIEHNDGLTECGLSLRLFWLLGRNQLVLNN